MYWFPYIHYQLTTDLSIEDAETTLNDALLPLRTYKFSPSRKHFTTDYIGEVKNRKFKIFHKNRSIFSITGNFEEDEKRDCVVVNIRITMNLVLIATFLMLAVIPLGSIYLFSQDATAFPFLLLPLLCLSSLYLLPILWFNLETPLAERWLKRQLKASQLFE